MRTRTNQLPWPPPSRPASSRDATSTNGRIRYIRQTVREYPWTFGICGAVFLAAYLLFDFREGGKASNLATIKLGNAEGYIKNFGTAWFWGMIVSNVVLAVLTALVITVAVATLSTASIGHLCCLLGRCSHRTSIRHFWLPGLPPPSGRHNWRYTLCQRPTAPGLRVQDRYIDRFAWRIVLADQAVAPNDGRGTCEVIAGRRHRRT
jgi:hypothetical protein